MGDERLGPAIRVVVERFGEEVFAQPDRLRALLTDELGSAGVRLPAEVEVIVRVATPQVVRSLGSEDDLEQAQALTSQRASDADEAQWVLDTLGEALAPDAAANGPASSSAPGTRVDDGARSSATSSGGASPAGGAAAASPVVPDVGTGEDQDVSRGPDPVRRMSGWLRSRRARRRRDVEEGGTTSRATPSPSQAPAATAAWSISRTFLMIAVVSAVWLVALDVIQDGWWFLLMHVVAIVLVEGARAVRSKAVLRAAVVADGLFAAWFTYLIVANIDSDLTYLTRDPELAVLYVSSLALVIALVLAARDTWVRRSSAT